MASIHSLAQTPGYQWTNFAGLPGGTGNADATGNVARFFDPGGVCLDASGNVLVADTANSAIRKVTPAGVVTTFAGLTQNSGTTNATGTAARFWNPRGVVMDSQGNFFVADQSNSVIRKITPAGVVSNFAGTTQSAGTADGTGSVARFNNPQGICIDASDNLYVADTSNHLIRKITPAAVVTTIAGTGAAGSADGTGTAASFNNPMGITVNSASGMLYVSDNTTHIVRQITLSTNAVITLAGLAGSSGNTNGTGNVARFSGPRGMCIDASGNILLCDRSNATIRQITPVGAVTTVAGTAGARAGTDGTGAAARFWDPDSICVDGSGTFTISDLGNKTIRRMTSAYGVTTLAGLARNIGSTNATGSAARFNVPQGIALDSSGNLYIADNNNHLIRKVTPGGVVTTFAGQTTAGFTNNTGTAAQFRNPDNIAIDLSTNTLYVADNGNHAIRVITSAGVVTTLAGTGTAGNLDATGTAAQFRNPQGVALDGLGNLWVADTGNHSIRKIVIATGVVTTPAGLSGSASSTDGTGTAARFNNPGDLVFNASGDLFIADRGNNSIRKMTSGLVVATFAGTSGSSGSADGLGTAARFNQPYRIGIDGSNYLYMGDANNHTIRKISPSGNVITIGGTALFGTSQDGTGASAWFSYPRDMAITSAGDVYLVENGNNRVSKGVPQLPIVTTGTASAIGPSSATLNGTLNPNATPTTAIFEYGLTTSYGSSVSIALSPNDDIATRNVSAAIPSGLTPNTLYHFRMSATNGATGVATSTDGTFTTTPPAPDILVEKPVGTVLLDGTGSVSLGSVITANSSGSQTFTIRNSGGQNLTGLAITVDGANAGEFTINTSGMLTTLTPGQTTTFSVVFTPLVSGARTADLHVASNVSGSKNPYDVNLTGAGLLPSGWSNADIGGPVPAGGTTYDSTTQQFTVSGGGTLINRGTSLPDKFQYAYQSVSGDFVATVRLDSMTSVSNAGNAPRAGLMLRKDTSATSAYVMLGIRHNGNAATTHSTADYWRVHDNDQFFEHSTFPSVTFPRWLRITRWGDKVHTEISPDGIRWAMDYGTFLDDLPANVVIGLCASSRDSTAVTTGVFSNFTVQPLTLTHQSSWLGNSIGGTYWGPHIMNAVHDIAIDNTTSQLFMGGENEARDLHIFDLNGNFRYWGETNGVNAVAIDGTNLFTGGDSFIERWRYDGVRTHQNTASALKPTGIAVVGANLYAVDGAAQQVRVFAKADLTENAAAAFSVTNPVRMTADASGFLWITQNNTGSTDKVLRYSVAGVKQTEEITLFSDSVVAGVMVHPSTGKIWVTDRGPRQQIHVFNADGSFNNSVGANGGIYSSAFGTIPGQPHPMKFNSPTDVEFDSSGNMYVTCMGASNRWTQGSGTELRKFDASNNQLWEKLNLVYVDNADPTPGTNGTEVYIQTRRITIDYSQPLGQQWTYAGCTFDPLTYPEDARATQSQPGGATVRIIGGQKILFITGMDANWVATYRFQTGSEIAIPCGLIKRETARGQPGNTFYIWVDADGDGATDSGEVDTSLTARSQVWGFTIDDNGGLWAADKGDDKIRYYPCKGLNSIGAPKYGSLYAGTSEQEWAVPSDFVGGTTVYPLRAIYKADSDELYVGGYRVGREEQQWSWKSAGSCLGRYTGWLAGSRTKQWLIDLPYDPGMEYNGDAKNGLAIIGSAAIAGDYVFAAFVPTLDVFVYNRFTGAFVQQLEAGPEICGNGALLDIVNGLSVLPRSNGEYVMWLEDDGAQKTNMYRWNAPPQGEITVEQPAGTPLTDGVSSIDFGSIKVGNSSSRNFVIRNDGSMTLWNLSINIDGAAAGDFSASALSSMSLAPGASMTFTLTCSPAAFASRAATMHVLSNDADEASFDIALAAVAYGPGQMDTNFNSTGSVTTPIGGGNDKGYGVAIQGDGKIVVSGTSYNGSNDDFAVVRYNANGSLDSTFGTGGKVTTAVGTANDEAPDVVIQADGKIVVAGTVFSGMAKFGLVRYLANGSLDTSFGSGGKVIPTIGTVDDHAFAIALDSAQRILVGGYSKTATQTLFCLARFLPNGQLDTSFDGDGYVTTLISGTGDTIKGICVQPDGLIIAAGYARPSGNYDIAVVRYLPNGQLDTSFDGDGKKTVAVGTSEDYGESVALQPDGKIVVAGGTYNGTNYDIAVVRLLGTGAEDVSFDGDGKVILTAGTDTDYAKGVVVQADGKIVIAGTSSPAPPSAGDFLVIRLLATGAPDTSFSTTGIVRSVLSSGDDYSEAVALQPDGSIVAAGSFHNGTNLDFAVVRYVGNPLPALTLGAATSLTSTTATLNGTVNPNGLATTAQFEYGTTTSYGSTASVTLSPNDGTSAQSVSTAITGLTPGVLYHFHLTATNAEGTAVSGDGTFTALPAQPEVTTLAGTSYSSTGGTLSGTVNPHGAGTTAQFEYGPTTSYGSTEMVSLSPAGGTTPQVVTATLSGLTHGTLYHWRLTASNSEGSTESADGTFRAGVVSGFSQFSTNGSATLNAAGTQATLTSGLTSQAGSVIGAVSQTISSFRASFVYQPGNFTPGGPADGLTFVLHNHPLGTAALGGSHGALGFSGLDMNSVAMELNLYSGNTVGEALGTNGSIGPYASSAPVDLASGHPILVELLYGGTTLTVTLTDQTTSAQFTRTHTVNIPTTVGASTAYIGFTGATGGLAASQAVSTFTFETLVPPAVTTAATTSLQATGATLNGTVNPNGIASTAQFEYGLTTSYGSTANVMLLPNDGTAAQNVSAAITGLTPGTLYHYRLTATSLAGTSVTSDGNFTTLAPEIVVEQPLGTNLTSGVSTVNFGNVVAGSNTSLTFTVRNTGNASLTGLTPSISGIDASAWSLTSSPTAPVAAGGSTTFTLRFAPSSFGGHSASVSIVNNDLDENPFVIALTGTGLASEITVSDDGGEVQDDIGSLVFDQILPSTTHVKTITVRNDGNATLTLGTPTVDGAHASSFTVNTSGMAASLAPNSTTTFTITFAPSSYGSKNAALHLSNNDPGENPFDLALEGQCVSIRAQMVPQGFFGREALRLTALGSANNALHISQTGGVVTIQAPNDWLGTLPGANLNGDGHTLTLPLAAVDVGIIADGGSGHDVFTIGPCAAPMCGLVINGDAGNDTLNIVDDLAFGAGSNLDANLCDDSTLGDDDRIDIAAGANITMVEGSNVSLVCSGRIAMHTGASVTGVNGQIKVSANVCQITQFGTYARTAGTFDGLTLDGALIESTGLSSPIVEARGGASGGTALVIINGGDIRTASGTGSLTVRADSMDLGTGPGSGHISAGSNQVNIAPVTPGTNIDLGGASAPGVLGLTDAQLDDISAGSIHLGDNNTGNINVSDNISRSAPTDLQLTSGGSSGLTFSGPNAKINTGGGNFDVGLSTGGVATNNPGTEPQIVADDVSITTGGQSIGSSTNPLFMDASTISTSSGNGAQFIKEQNNATVGGGGIRSGSGGIFISGGTLEVTAPGALTGPLTFSNGGAIIGNGAPPSVGSLPAVFTSTNLTFQGTVNANGSPTTVSFENDTDNDGTFARSDPPTTQPATDTSVQSMFYSRPSANLVAGATYYHRLVATNANGTSYSSVVVTPPQPQVDVRNPLPMITGQVLDLGSVNVGSSSSASTVTIRSAGTASLAGIAVSKTGANTSDFTIGSPGATTLVPLGTTTFTVSFSPSAGGMRSATLHVTSNDPDDGDFTIVLTGTGIAPDTSGPTGGTMSISPGTSVSPSSSLTVSFSGWNDPSTPLTYAVLVEGAIVSAQGSSSSRTFTAPSSPGTYTLKGRVYDALNNLTETTQTLTVIANTPQQTWRQTWFGTTSNTGNAADNADPDKDGIPNLLEWACNLNPNTASTLPAAVARNGSNLEFTCTRSVSALNAGTGFVVEWSDLLPGTSWSSSGVTEQILSNNGTVQQVKALVPAGAAGRRFVHLKVTAPP